ncbi:MAG TPA: hypothetical protein VLJ39_13330 [Tepidisphaeraceae bacterium]|nr:hypothetical protein [Tepidisphaeraceae bacterium]
MPARLRPLSILLLWVAPVLAAAPTATDRFEIPNVCSIGTPGKGWEWKAVNEYDEQKGGTYLCSAEGKPGRLILRVDPGKRSTDDERILTLKQDFNLLHQQLEKLGCTDIKGKRPELKPPIPENVDYFVIGKTPKGSTINLHAETIFKTHTYLLQAAAPSLKEAETLAATGKTLKE